MFKLLYWLGELESANPERDEREQGEIWYVVERAGREKRNQCGKSISEMSLRSGMEEAPGSLWG